MKKILTLIAVSVASIALAVADPIIVGHGYFGFGALGTTFEKSSTSIQYPAKGTYGYDDEASVFGAFGKNLEFGGGLAVNIPFGGYFGIQPGVDFYVNTAGFKSGDYIYDFNYLSLDIPVLFTIKLDKWNFSIGPNFSIPLGDVTKTYTYSNGTVTEKITNEQKWNVSLSVGVGYEERLGMGRLVFGGRYLLDFLPIHNDKSSVTDIDYFNFTRRSLLIDIGYKLPLSFFGL